MYVYILHMYVYIYICNTYDVYMIDSKILDQFDRHFDDF